MCQTAAKTTVFRLFLPSFAPFYPAPSPAVAVGHSQPATAAAQARRPTIVSPPAVR